MSSPAISVDKEVNVRDAALLMTNRGIGSLIVTERGQPIGIVTERDILERVVSLCRDPCEVRLKEIISSPLITVPKEADILNAMREMRRHDISRLVVVDDDEVVGIVSEKDVVRGVSIAALTSFSILLRKRG